MVGVVQSASQIRKGPPLVPYAEGGRLLYGKRDGQKQPTSSRRDCISSVTNRPRQLRLGQNFPSSTCHFRRRRIGYDVPSTDYAIHNASGSIARRRNLGW